MSSPQSGEFWIEAVENYADLKDCVEDWDLLARNALEPNPFFESWMFLAAMRIYAKDVDRFVFALVYTMDDAKVRTMVGFFPFRQLDRYRGLVPCKNLSLWKYDPCSLATPLIHRLSPDKVINTLLDWVEAGSNKSTVLEFTWVAGEGEFARVFKEICKARKSPVLGEEFSRAFFRRRESSEDYLAQGLSANKRRDLNRKRRLLEKKGNLTFDQLGAEGDLYAWMNEFLELESSGWKGREKTALLSVPREAEFFREMVTSGYKRGQLWMTALRLDGRAISMRCNILSPPGSFFSKPAYDEDYGKYSPGVLLEVETIRWLHDMPGIGWMDSCTSPDNELLNKLWLDRKTILSFAVGSRTLAGRLIVTVHLFVRWLKALRKLRWRKLSPE